MSNGHHNEKTKLKTILVDIYIYIKKFASKMEIFSQVKLGY